MKLDAFLVLGEPNWELVVGDSFHTTTQPNWSRDSSAETAAAIARFLESSGAGPRQKIGIGLPSWLFYPVDLRSHSMRDDIDQLKFQLEADLPVDAEQMAVATFPATQSSAIVLDVTYVLDVIAECAREFDVHFRWITSTAIALATSWQTAARKDIQAANSASLFVFDTDSCDLFECHQGGFRWHFLPGKPNREETLSDEEEGLRFVIDRRDQESESESLTVIDYRQSIVDLTGQDVERSPWQEIDFSEQLYSRAGITRNAYSRWEFAALAFIVGLVLCSIAFQVRATNANQVTIALEDRSRAEYRELFPGSRINAPLDLLFRQKTEEIEEFASLAEFSDRNARILTQLAQVLAALPNEKSLRIRELEVSPTFVRISGRVESLAELDQLMDTIRSRDCTAQLEGDYARQFRMRIESDVRSGP